MAQIDVPLSEGTNASGDIYKIEITDNLDYVVLPASNRLFTLEITGVTVDSINLYATTDSTADASAIDKQVFDKDGVTNPLIEDQVFYASHPYQKIKIEKVGGTDTLTVVVNFKNRE